jgi:hypothetical protein
VWEVVLVSAAERRCGRRDGGFDGGDGEPNGGDEIRVMKQPVFSLLIDRDRNLASSKLLDSLAQATEKVCTNHMLDRRSVSVSSAEIVPVGVEAYSVQLRINIFEGWRTCLANTGSVLET